MIKHKSDVTLYILFGVFINAEYNVICAYTKNDIKHSKAVYWVCGFCEKTVQTNTGKYMDWYQRRVGGGSTYYNIQLPQNIWKWEWNSNRRIRTKVKSKVIFICNVCIVKQNIENCTCFGVVNLEIRISYRIPVSPTGIFYKMPSGIFALNMAAHVQNAVTWQYIEQLRVTSR